MNFWGEFLTEPIIEPIIDTWGRVGRVDSWTLRTFPGVWYTPLWWGLSLFNAVVLTPLFFIFSLGLFLYKI